MRVCDICKKPYSETLRLPRMVEYVTMSEGKLVSSPFLKNEIIETDLCESCMKDFASWLMNKQKEYETKRSV